MGKKNKCILTPRGRKSKDQGGKEIKGRATIYTPAKNIIVLFVSFFSRVHATLHPALSVGWSVGPHFTFFCNFIFLSHFRVNQVILSQSVSLARDL